MADELYKGVLRGHWSDGSGETRNIFYGTMPSPSDTDAAATMQGYVAAFCDAAKGLIDSSFQFYGCDVYKYISNNVWQLILETGLSIAGTNGSTDSLPHQIAAVLVGRTQNGRSRPKKFLPGVVEGVSTGTGWTSAALLILAQVLLAWISDYTDSITNITLHPVCHRKGKTDLDIIGGRADNVQGTQRRRKIGLGI